MAHTILLLEDEAFVLVNLELAAQDMGLTVISALNAKDAIRQMDELGDLDVAVLDVNLGGGETCLPVVRHLQSRAIPYLLHSGDLDREREFVREFGAPLIPKPAVPEFVIESALSLLGGQTAPARNA